MNDLDEFYGALGKQYVPSPKELDDDGPDCWWSEDGNDPTSYKYDGTDWKALDDGGADDGPGRCWCEEDESERMATRAARKFLRTYSMGDPDVL